MTKSQPLPPLSHADPRLFPAGFIFLSAALFAWYLVTYVFLPILPVRPGIDESWRSFLTWAFQHHKQFGTEVIFTYGPWGFLLEPMGTIAIYPWQICGRFVLAAAASSGIALLGVCWIRSAALRSLWAATIALLADPSLLIPVLLFLATMPAVARLRLKSPILVLIAVAAGLVACTKFTCFLLVGALLLLVLIRRRLAAVAAVTVVSFFLFWVLARQAISNLPAFVSQSAALASGYASAMVTGRPRLELLLAVILCALPLLQLTVKTMPPVDLDKLSRLAWLALSEFLLFRHGIIRSDPLHWYAAFLTAAVPIVILLTFLPAGSSTAAPAWWKSAYATLLLAAFAVTLSSTLWEIKERGLLFLESLRLYPVYARELFSPPHTPPPAAGSVDVFPDELSYAIRKNLPLHNRPVIQAYSAFTVHLSQQNAAFLEGPLAPRTIYLHSGFIDGRYPTMEDSLVWRSLLTHYTPSAFADEYLVLQHREHPAPYQLKPILDRAIRTDEVLEIPSLPADWIWAEIDVQRTPFGRLLDLFYRKEKLALHVETARRSLDFTFLDEVAPAGFLLSPCINGQSSLLDFFQREPQRFAAENVRRILLHRDATAWGFGRNVRVRLYSLVLQTEPDLPGGLTQQLGRTVRAERPLGSVALSPVLALSGGELRLMVGSPSSASIPRPTGKSLHVRYGNEAGRSTCSGDVSFQILWGGADPTAEKHVLWQQSSHVEADRNWSAQTTIPLPDTNQPTLYFETTSPNRSCGVEGIYWADLAVGP